MVSPARIAGLTPMLRSAHFWVILTVLAGLGVLHYIEELGLVGASPSLHFGLERHAMDRILFLLPIVYALFVFGVGSGVAASSVALSFMLPRAIIWSPNPRDALFEIACVMLIAVAVGFWFRSRVRAEEQRQRAAAEMDSMQTELASHMRIIKRAEVRMAMLNAISSMLTHSFQLEQLLRSAVDMVMEVMEVEVALIFTLDERADELTLVAHDGVGVEFVREVARIRVGEGFNGLVAQQGEPLVVEDALLDPRATREALKQERIEAQLIVPLKAKGRIRGTLCVANRRPRQFLPQEVELLTAIGNPIAVAIENSHLYEEQQMIAAQYRGIFENASEAIWVEDLEGRILAANEATVSLTGYDRGDLLTMKSTSLNGAL